MWTGIVGIGIQVKTKTLKKIIILILIFKKFVKFAFRCVINHTQHDQNIINDDGGVIAVEEYKLPYEAEISHNPSIGKYFL